MQKQKGLNVNLSDEKKRIIVNCNVFVIGIQQQLIKKFESKEKPKLEWTALK